MTSSVKFALARSNGSSFLLITQYEMPFINKSEATKRSKDRKIYGKYTNGTNRRSRIWPVFFIYIGVVSGVISSTESGLEESERFHFFRFRLLLRRWWSLWKLCCRSRKQKRKNQRITRPGIEHLSSLVYPSASACDSDNAVFTWS